ncbi:hypothetical protein [Lactiplantibacillus garii]|nr:hypothetical protein [Lactiplantibacillus garii]
MDLRISLTISIMRFWHGAGGVANRKAQSDPNTFQKNGIVLVT